MPTKLPLIKYKIHPKMHQIIQQKQKRKQILSREYQKLRLQERNTRKQKKQYFQANKNTIKEKKQAIYSKKLEQHNKIREEDRERLYNIELKKSERLQRLLPERAETIQQLKLSYILYLQEKDQLKQLKIRQMMEKRLEEANRKCIELVPIEVRIQEQNLIDINERQCILCLSADASIYMVECRHLISCQDCEFMLRLQKKCPVCRKYGNYKGLNFNKIKGKLSNKK